jgi:hypothetical protein
MCHIAILTCPLIPRLPWKHYVVQLERPVGSFIWHVAVSARHVAVFAGMLLSLVRTCMAMPSWGNLHVSQIIDSKILGDAA